MIVKSVQVWAGSFATTDSTGALLASTTAPTAVLYVNGVSNAAAVTVTGSNPYKWSVTLPSLTAGDTVEIYASATIATIPVSQFVAAATADTSRPSDVAAELAKVPKSDSTVSWNATALAAILTQVNAALNVAIPGSPTADSINERVKAIDDRLLGTLAAGTHTAQTGDSYARIGAPAGASVSADILQIKNYVDDIGVAGAGLTALGDTRLANLDATISSRTKPADTQARVTLVDTATTLTNMPAAAPSAAAVATQVWTGPDTKQINSVSGSVGSVSGLTAADVAAIKAVTDKLDTAMVLDGAVYQFTANALELAASGGLNAAQTGDAVLDEVVDGTHTLRQMMRIVAAALAGKSDGGESTTNHFRDLADTKNRITATVDAAGNRTAVTLDVT